MAEEILLSEDTPIDKPEPLPFPFNQRAFCRYEPIEKRIEAARVLIVDDLLRDERDISETAVKEWGRHLKTNLQYERKIAGLALDNIRNNVLRLVRKHEIRVTHYSEVAEAEREFRPDAILLSGTLRDFDFYNPDQLEKFGEFIRSTNTAVLGICGGHQLVGMSFGARVQTLDHMEQHEHREGRPFEYQYR
ncbi:MAG TPA: hypothetical protein VEV81_10165, partial [Pyrinomonadaceae bacterium]|nr:hypothetical protein [Pyrinomonadaceae bacterium]